MSTRPSRGRAVRPRRNANTRYIFIAAGVLAIIGIIAVSALALNQPSALEGRTPDLTPINAPTGRTADGYYFKGQESAPVVVVEYADFQCPACAQYASRIAPSIDAQYVETGQVRMIYHEMPLRQHANAFPAAEAARCAGDQNAFWQMHDMLFLNQAQWQSLAQPAGQFAGYAAQIGLDRAAFERCMSDGTHRSAIQAAQAEADALQIPGTPTFIINGQQYDAGQIQQAIDAALAGQ
ncbi:MAG TPA: DsbA family protein [Roseiflexaceae bacterium]|mgnify:CR=1 FL=1|nr:DsbA family protein [Roseiflexaceae bacterium]HMP39904.1 DsbA family protein [Roseiflexaceae bacterium]